MQWAQPLVRSLEVMAADKTKLAAPPGTWSAEGCDGCGLAGRVVLRKRADEAIRDCRRSLALSERRLPKKLEQLLHVLCDLDNLLVPSASRERWVLDHVAQDHLTYRASLSEDVSTIRVVRLLMAANQLLLLHLRESPAIAIACDLALIGGGVDSSARATREAG